MERKTKPIGVFFLLTAAIVWGIAFVFQTIGSDHVTALPYNAMRFAIGSVVLIPVFMILEKNATDKNMMKTTVKAGISAGVVLFIAAALQQTGIELYLKAGFNDGSGRAGFLTTLYMVIVPLFGLFLKRRPKIQAWIGVLLGMIGMFLISFSGGFSIRYQDLVVIACAVMYALHITVIDVFGDNMYSIRFSSIQFATTAVLSLIASVVLTSLGMINPTTIEDVKLAIIPILYGGLGSVGIAFTFQVLGQKNTAPTLASMLMSLESVFSVIGGAIILHEKMTMRGYLGCIIIFAGVILAQLEFDSKKKVKE